MNNVTKSIYGVALLLFSVAVLLTVFLVAIRQFGPETRITSTSVLERVQEQYFVVTKTVVVDQNTKIVVDEGSAWSNFLWGQEIEAEALIRLDIGVDLSELTEDDIIIDQRRKTITIDLPAAEILDASQFGDIEVNSRSGILKFLLDRDPNEDHNLSLDQLIRDAKASVLTDATLFEEAKQNSANLLQLIVENLGYELIIAN